MNLNALIHSWSQPGFFSREKGFILLQQPTDYLEEKGETHPANFFMALGLTAPGFTSYSQNALANLHQSKLFALSVFNVCLYVSSEPLNSENDTLINNMLPIYFSVLDTYFQETDMSTLFFIKEKSETFMHKENLDQASNFYTLLNGILEKRYLEKNAPLLNEDSLLGRAFKV